MRVFQPVDVDVPVHPLGRANRRAAILLAFANRLGVLVGDQLLVQQTLKGRFGPGVVNLGQIILHLFPHEHSVRADVDDSALLQQSLDQLLDFRINERFAAADRDHGGIALHRRAEAILERHHVLEAGGIFPNPPATCAGQITSMERFELQHHGEFGRAQQFVFNDVPGDFRRQRQWKSHMLDGFYQVIGLTCAANLG